MSSAAESAFAEGQAQVSPTLAPDQSIPPTESAEKPHKKISAAEAAFAEGQGVAPEQEDVPFAEKLKTTPYEGLSKLQQDRLTTFTTPEEIAQIPKHIPKTEDQLRTQFEHERSLPWNEGMRTPEDWYNIGKEVIGTGVKFAKGVKKYAQNSLFAGAEEDPSGWGKPSIQPTKDLVSSAVQLPEDVAYFGTKLAEGGTDWTDRLSEKFGLHDKQKSFENYKARHMVDMAHAQTLQETPSVYGRVLKNEMANKALAAVILNTLPDTKTIMEQDGISEEQANAKRQSMADQIAQQTTSDSAAQEKAADEDIALTGSFMMPAGLGLGEMGAVGLAAETAMGLSPKIAQGLKYLGKTDAEIKAMNDAAQALQKQKLAEKIEKRKQPSMVGRTAGAIAEGVDKLQALREAAPEGLKNLLPVGVGAFAGYETDKEHPLMGALIGGAVGHGAAPLLKLGAYAAKAPALIRDIDEARALAAGGSKGTFETLGSIPDVSEQTAKILRFGGKNLDNIINNSVEYAKAGIHPTLVALATGALDSASPEERNQMLSTGLLYGLGGRALHHTLGKITGVDPVIEQRERQQQAVDDYKTYKDLDPETQKAMNGLTSWDNVIKRHEKMVSDAMVAYNDAVRSGSKDAEKLGKALTEERKTLSAVTRANVQTRNEFSRNFLTQLTKLNELTNGTLRAGQNNVGVHILTPDQIFEKFRKDPANNGMSDADIMETANQQGFYSTPEGAVEYQAGMPMGGVKKTLIFDRTKPSIVINANHLKARQQIFGETPTEALTHEFGHHIRNIPEFREANREAEDLLFAQDIKDLNGNVTATTSGRYSTKDLVDMYQSNYMKGKSPDQIEQLSRLAGLWDDTRGALNEQAVADYMKDEIVAQLNAGTLSNHLGKDLDSGTLHLMDVATLKTKKNLLDKAVQKFFGLGGKGSAVDPLTGAEFSPEIIAANRQAMRALQALQGEVSPAVKAPDAPKISRALMIKNRAIMEKYGKYSGLFKTKMQGQIYDAEGNPVGAPVEITNPAAAEGSWATDRQLSGYGQKPDEVRGMNIPDGGRLVVSQSFVTEADGVTPAMYTPQEAKKLQKARKNTIIQALDTPDHGTPNRFQPVADNSETFRGTFTPLQIQAIKDLPEGIIPKSIKDHILKINDAIVKGDGSRLLVDYAAVMNDAGRYTAYSPKIYDVVPIGMHLSKDGNFLVTTISVGRMFEKLNAWSQRMPARLSPWGGDKNAFFKEFTEKYLKNWQYREKDAQGNEMYPQGRAGEYGLSGTPAEALAKKNIFNDFLNLTTNEFRDANDDRTRTPRQRGDVRGKDIDRTIMSMRLDHMAELMDNEYAPKVPVNYGNAIKNFMPAEEAVIEPQEERKPSAIDLDITAAHSPESRPFSAQYVAPTAKYPTSEQGFYSGLQKVVDEKMPAKASPQQILSIVNNPQNAKADEVKWSNLAGFVEGKDSVTKQEVLDYLKNEGSVKFEERTLSKPNVGPWGVSNYLGDRPTEPKYSQYVLPNGENYKEVVLTMPNNFTPKKLSWDEIGMEKFGKPYSELTEEQFAEVEKESNKRKEENSIGYQKQNEYKSSHFQDTPNYVAHMRLNERKDASGKDGLFIEEIQSDRHQQGREKGYGDQSVDTTGWSVVPYKDNTRWLVLDAEGNQIATPSSMLREDEAIEKAAEIYSKNQGTKVPDAPFRKDWSVQMFKRALRDAIDSGKEWIGWTSGDTQAERYDLSKQVRFIAYNKVGDKIGLIAKDNSFQTIIARQYDPSELPDVIGKEVAQKIINGEGTYKKTELSNGDVINMKHLSGVDLKVGGEGMKGFYDQILPKEIGKYVKKWGAKVEEGDIKTDPNEYDTTPIWKVEITPEMRDSIQKGGQIQFMPSRDGEEERITAATYTNPRTGKVTEGATHLIANPSAPQEATDRESPAYGFKTSSGGIVDRATAYQIAKDAGQLKAPTTEEEKFLADRGILHSGMYEPKGNISFMPASKQDEAHAKAIESGDMEEAQRLVDEAARKAGYGITAYHVSQSTDIKVPSGNRGVAAHVTFSKTLADQLSVRDGENPKIYNWYVKGDIFDPENPNHIKRLEDAESNWPLTAPYPEQIQHSGTWKQLENPALQSIIKKAGFDGYYDRSNVGSSWKDSAAIFDANNIKSADPATYDDEGKLIPLSQRFDTSKQDIRFMPDSDLPKTEDGKVDWEGFKTKTQETAKPLAGLAPIGGVSFRPESKDAKQVDKGDENSLPIYQKMKNGKPVLKKGDPVYVQEKYNLVNAPAITQYKGTAAEDPTPFDFKSLAYDVTGPQQKKIDSAIASGAVDHIANQVVKKTQEYLKTPEISAGKGWYSRMRKNLLDALGEDGRELVSQLLGATSAKTPVNQNFLQAMDGYEGIKNGRYDENRKSYLEMLDAQQKGELANLIRERGYIDNVKQMADELSKGARKLTGKKKQYALDAAKDLRDLTKISEENRTPKQNQKIMMLATNMIPMRSNGRKFNANSLAVLKVIGGTWLANRKSPKTPNFAGNLSGRTIQATIDVWAARFLRQIMFEGYGQPWRIQPKSETGVSNEDFALGQIILKRAADKLGMNPDDLQAVLWFAEKHNWDQRGWTKNEGAEKSSFDEIFHVFFPKGKKPLSFAEASKIFAEMKEEDINTEDEEEND